MARTEADDDFGNTFYSEIDVIDAGSPAPKPVSAAGNESIREEFTAGRGRYKIVIDTSKTPDLTGWTRTNLAPVIMEWYPKIATLLADEGYEAARKILVVFSGDMKGVAETGGMRIRCGAAWFRENLETEAKGAVVHELAHVAQGYGARPAFSHTPSNPLWLVEGIADYVRWFKYEPESRGAMIDSRFIRDVRYDAGYRTTANFLNWVSGKHGEHVVTELNAAMRKGRYTDGIWKELTGHSLPDLAGSWKDDLRKN